MSAESWPTSLLRNGFDLTVRDLNDALVQSFVDRGATQRGLTKRNGGEG